MPRKRDLLIAGSIAPRMDAHMAYPHIELYIDGRWRTAPGAPIINPADETVIGTVARHPSSMMALHQI
jgi:hypothetical protein